MSLTPRAALWLTLPPLFWAGNAVIGRAVQELVPPITLNFLRWAVALLLLLPLAGWVLRPGSPMWPHWRRFAWLGLLGVGCYNALQYLALKTSTPINVTLVAASMPVWMLAVGRLFFGQPVQRRQLLGTVLSVAGVLVVLSRGDVHSLLALRLVPGDLLVLVAAIAWAFYSWLLTRPDDPPAIRNDWAAFLMAQIALGVVWSAAFAAGEWAWAGRYHFEWGWPLLLALAYVAVFPAILAYRFWGLGVQAAGPAMAAFFSNLTPLFAALMSAAFLGESPRVFHGIAFALIVAGIAVSSRR